jgi:hypothetical protein
MKGEGYSTYSSEDLTTYYFKSIGIKGEIAKVVAFQPIGNSVWNLSFGDGGTEDFDDEIVSNNNDVRSVLQTIANVVHSFSKEYPDRKIFIKPVDGKRNRLYNGVIRRKASEIAAIFLIFGLNQQLFEPYDYRKNYDGFLLVRKKC